MMNRLAALLLAAGLLAQTSSIYQQTHEPVLQMETPTPTPQQTHLDPAAFGAPADDPLAVVPIAQETGDSAGQTSVAMAINCLTGKQLDGERIYREYGYELLRALREECADVGLDWRDGGEIGPDRWELVEHKVNQEQLPVILALNGPEFSVNGRGHIVLVCKVEGEKVTFADPATGTMRTTTRSNINRAPSHPQGNFLFYAQRDETFTPRLGD